MSVSGSLAVITGHGPMSAQLSQAQYPSMVPPSLCNVCYMCRYPSVLTIFTGSSKSALVHGWVGHSNSTAKSHGHTHRRVSTYNEAREVLSCRCACKPVYTMQAFSQIRTQMKGCNKTLKVHFEISHRFIFINYY